MDAIIRKGKCGEALFIILIALYLPVSHILIHKGGDRVNINEGFFLIPIEITTLQFAGIKCINTVLEHLVELMLLNSKGIL